MTAMKPLRILMLTTVRFHNSKGGTEKVMIDTANAMAERGHHVVILYKDKNGDTPGFPLNESVKTFNCYHEKIPFSVSGLMRMLRSFSFSREKQKQKLAFLKLKKLACTFKSKLIENPADIYITYEPKLSAMLLREFQIKNNVITTFQFSPQYIANRSDTKYLEPDICGAGPIQVLRNEFSATTKKLFHSAQDIIVIPNAVSPNNCKSTLSNKTIINVGRVIPQKNQALLAEAFGQINNKYKDWQIQIWGEDNLDKKYSTLIKRIIQQHNMQNQFKLCGPTDNVYEKLREASIFVFPSIHEGFGLALGEAMATGLACIGLKSCTAVNSLIRHRENGLLCDNDKDALAECLSQLIDSYDLRKKFAENALNDISNYYPENIWKIWEDTLYKYSLKKI